MTRMHRPPLKLRSALEMWLSSLGAGHELPLIEGLKSCPADDRFLLGLHCAMFGLSNGMMHVLEGLSQEDVQDMGVHWLETAIFHENHDIVDAIRATGLDPCAPFKQARSFESGGLFQRRNAWASQWLEDIQVWNDPFVSQWKRSRLPALFLHRAIHHNNLSTVKFILDLGASLNTSTEAQLPLWASLRAGKAPVMKLLLDRGADIHQAGQMDNKTLLVAAAQRGLVDCVWLLVDAGASLSDRSCGIDAPFAAQSAGHVRLASEMSARALSHAPAAVGMGASRRL